MPDCVALAITSPVGTIVHTGDFKIDQTPIDGEHFDLHRFAELGAQGVLALFADSTNIDRKGFTGPEIEVIDAFEELFTSTRRQAGRRALLVEHLPDAGAGRPGRAVRTQGRLRRPQHRQERRDRAAPRLPARAGGRPDPRRRRARTTPRRTCSASRPARRASRRRRSRASPSTTTASCKLGPDDTVVFSARAIPGNEKAIARTMSHIARRGADVVTDSHEARARVGPRQRRGAEAGALAGPARATSCRSTASTASSSQHARIAQRVMRGTDRELQVLLAAGRRHHPVRRARRPHRRQGADRPRADRRHAHRRSRRRSAARPPAPCGRRRGRRGGRHQPADRSARRRAGARRPRLRRDEGRGRARCSGTPPGSLPSASKRRASRNAPTRA